MVSAWELAEEVVKAVNAGGGIVTGAYVREYIVRKGALDGRGKWSVGIEPPPVIRIWVSQENLEEVMGEIMSRKFFMKGTAAHGHEISLFDANACTEAARNAMPSFADVVVRGPNMAANPMVEVSWRLFSDSIDIIRDGAYSFEIGSYDSEEIAFESDGLCISEGVIQQLEIRGASAVKEWNPYESMINVNRVCTDILCGRLVCLPEADAFASGAFGSASGSAFGSGIGQTVVNEMVERRWTVTVGCVKKIPCAVDREVDGHCLICHEDLGAAHWQMECCQGRYHEGCLLVAFRQGPAAMATTCKCLLCKMPFDHWAVRAAVHVLSGGKETVLPPMDAVEEEDEEEDMSYTEADDIGNIAHLLGGVNGYEEAEAEATAAVDTRVLGEQREMAVWFANRRRANAEEPDEEEEEEEEDEDEDDEEERSNGGPNEYMEGDRVFDDAETAALVAAAQDATEQALAQTEWAEEDGEGEEEDEDEDEEEDDDEDNNACGLLDGSSENYVIPFNLTNLLSRREALIRQQAGSLFGPFI